MDRDQRDQPDWLHWVREVQAIGQSGLAYCENEFDRERYQRLLEISARLTGQMTGLPDELLLRSPSGFAATTPSTGRIRFVFRRAVGRR